LQVDAFTSRDQLQSVRMLFAGPGMNYKTIWPMLSQTFSAWNEHDAPHLGSFVRHGLGRPISPPGLAGGQRCLDDNRNILCRIPARARVSAEHESAATGTAVSISVPLRSITTPAGMITSSELQLLAARGSMVDFEFSCAMNINNGRVRSVELNLVRVKRPYPRRCSWCFCSLPRFWHGCSSSQLSSPSD
jgi:hypothetical protein